MNTMLYQDNRIVLLPQYENPKVHRHFAKHLIICDKPFRCMIEGTEKIGCSMLIQSQVSHTVLRDEASKMIIFLIDETSSLSKHLDKIFLQNASSHELPTDLEKDILTFIKAPHSLQEIDSYILKKLTPTTTSTALYDDRIQLALTYIDSLEALDKTIYDVLPPMLCLSKSRFLHLFKEEVGINFKNYILIKKLEKAYSYVIENHMSITDAAILSGFSSASHFADACRKQYGIALTDFIKTQQP